jgi:4-hydroxymandelate oxidase
MVNLTSVAEAEHAAEAAIDRDAWNYLARGCGAGFTLRANAEAWQRMALHPHMLRDMSVASVEAPILGRAAAAPILVAPTAMHRLFTPDGELATAVAAAACGLPYVVSMAATTSLEDIAAAVPGAALWAQMYLLRDRGRSRALVERARDAGYQALVVSVDGAPATRGTSRVAGEAFIPPPWVTFPNLALPGDDSSDIMRLIGDFDPSVTFDDLARLREWSGLPVVVKGIVRADDAVQAVEAGVAAIDVSNHGGRMVDGVASTAAVLAPIVDAVGDRAEVYVDGGIRSGGDVAKALALGARAVLVGRPVLWGLGAAGADGATAVLTMLRDEFEAAMVLCGAQAPAGLSRELLLQS